MTILKPSVRSINLKSPIRDMVKIGKKLEEKGMEVFYFNIGDPNKFDFDTPDYLKEELKKVVDDKSGFYSSSEGDEELIDAVVEKENKTNHLDLTADDVVITEGISEGLVFLFGSLIEPGRGDEVLLPGPAYPPYIEYIKFFDGKPITFKMDEENDWQVDTDDLRSKVNEKTRAIIIINPNNPTGAVYDKSTLREILNVAAENDKVVVSDEIYDKLVFGGASFHNTASLANDVSVIGLNGFSKVYLVPGWRMGYMYFHDPNDKLMEMKEAVKNIARQRLSASTPLMKACAKAFTGPQDHIKTMVKKLSERVEFAHKRLNEILNIYAVKPRGAFYIFPRINLNGRWKSDEEFCTDVLNNTGIVFPYGSGFDPIYGKDHFRSVILPPIEIMERAFDKLDKFMRSV